MSQHVLARHQDLRIVKVALNIVEETEVLVDDWLEALTDSDRSFVRTLVLSSGSLKGVAQAYGVSYPTVRTRLDRIIQKIEAVQAQPADPFVTAITGMMIDGILTREAAEQVLGAHGATTMTRRTA